MCEEFSKTIVNQSVARVCLALGFEETSQVCLDSLTDIAHHYIRCIGEKSKEQSEYAGRAHAGIQDVIATLGSSAFGRIPWKDLRDFAFSDVKHPEIDPKWNQPFHLDVSEFPIKKSEKRSRDPPIPEFENKEKDEFQSIPAYLPPFPPKHTYKRSVKAKTDESSSSLGTRSSLNNDVPFKIVQNALISIENLSTDV
jgi:hypothetical protein